MANERKKIPELCKLYSVDSINVSDCYAPFVCIPPVVVFSCFTHFHYFDVFFLLLNEEVFGSLLCIYVLVSI